MRGMVVRQGTTVATAVELRRMRVGLLFVALEPERSFKPKWSERDRKLAQFPSATKNGPMVEALNTNCP